MRQDHEELLGADVIVPHRMSKNQVFEQAGIGSYALFSEAAATALCLSEVCENLHDYTDSGSIRAPSCVSTGTGRATRLDQTWSLPRDFLAGLLTYRQT